VRDSDGDETVVLTPPTKRGSFGRLALSAFAGALFGAAAALWLLWPQRTVPPPAIPPQVQVPTAPAPAFTLQSGSESEIREHVARALTIFSFAPDPNIVVMDFPTLLQQGLMLNRVAALVEKSGLPRDRVLTDAELDHAIKQRGDTVETFYYGHDYAASELVRFFSLADRDQIQLNEEERRLRSLLEQLGWFEPGRNAGLITIPRIGAESNVTATTRATILRHELAHGEFFSNPAYADYVRRFWQNELTESERGGIRRFLGSQEYDTADEELMLNEMQAYLMFTFDPHFFKTADAGMTEERRAELQKAFRSSLQVPWLRDNMDHPLAGAP
jgi:hypothetical protein